MEGQNYLLTNRDNIRCDCGADLSEFEKFMPFIAEHSSANELRPILSLAPCVRAIYNILFYSQYKCKINFQWFSFSLWMDFLLFRFLFYFVNKLRLWKFVKIINNYEKYFFRRTILFLRTLKRSTIGCWRRKWQRASSLAVPHPCYAASLAPTRGWTSRT